MKSKLITFKKEKEVISVKEEGLHQFIFDIPTGNVIKQVDVILEEEGTEAEVLGVFVGNKDQQIDITVNAIHKVPNTRCLTQIRGVLKDQAYSQFKGMIKIEKDAQQTYSYLDDDVLILGEEARNESQPMLEIEADDVKASHGATTGRILEEHLFYLKSRGIPQEEAERIIVEGFLEPVLTKMRASDKFKKKVFERI